MVGLCPTGHVFGFIVLSGWSHIRYKAAWKFRILVWISPIHSRAFLKSLFLVAEGFSTNVESTPSVFFATFWVFFAAFGLFVVLPLPRVLHSLGRCPPMPGIQRPSQNEKRKRKKESKSKQLLPETTGSFNPLFDHNPLSTILSKSEPAQKTNKQTNKLSLSNHETPFQPPSLLITLFKTPTYYIKQSTSLEKGSLLLPLHPPPPPPLPRQNRATISETSNS